MEKRKHKVLIVDDEKALSQAIGPVMEKIGVEYLICENSDHGLEILTKSSFPFSLAISVLHSSGGAGLRFLGQVKEKSPKTIRFLISDTLNMEQFVKAVNKGIVQQYVQKPWEISDIAAKVKEGVVRFRHAFENEKLVQHTIKQNKKLYLLSNVLDEKVSGHIQKMERLDRETAEIRARLAEVKAEINKGEHIKAGPQSEYFEKFLKNHDLLEKSKFNNLFNDTIRKLFREFSTIAQKSGFELPHGQIRE